jgi:hypothetical protein
MPNFIASVLIVLGVLIATCAAFFVGTAVGVMAVGVSFVVVGYLGADE